MVRNAQRRASMNPTWASPAGSSTNRWELFCANYTNESTAGLTIAGAGAAIPTANAAAAAMDATLLRMMFS
ncbi:hypothetical protein CZ765_11600 [Corynebacterium casei]|nr:hypothetical protein CZ765_11600 [Corynebacterium casei]